MDGGNPLHTYCQSSQYSSCLPSLLQWVDMQPTQPTPLRDSDHLEELLASSGDQPVLLFKHSETCGISCEAYDELIAHMAEDGTRAHYAMVTVQERRELSNAVASRLGVRHETPQVILVRDRRVIWTASHFRINAQTLNQALATA
jgi:bacillithiol system protein YtxJ